MQNGNGHIALFLNTLAGGGAERVFINLARVFSERGYRVDIVASRLTGSLAGEVPESVRTFSLGTRGGETRSMLVRLPWKTLVTLPRMVLFPAPKVIRSLPVLVRYLREERPDAMMSTVGSTNVVALWADWFAGGRTRIFIREACEMSALAAAARRPFKKKLPDFARQWYPKADGIISVSEGVANDLSHVTGIEKSRIKTIHNPVDIASVRRRAAERIDEPWFAADQPPVILSAGRLASQKDYSTLLRAFALLRRRRPARLIILGEGRERRRLEALARELRIADDVRMPGHVKNPYAYMDRASLFALSSAWEGCPNVIIEALACGCPVVSTDCDSGPAELLDHGAYGWLVPVGDADALGSAMDVALDRPGDSRKSHARAEMFPLGAIADKYLEVLGSNGDLMAGAGRRQVDRCSVSV